MRRKGWLALAMLAAGAGLLAAAQLAGASGTKAGGIFRVGMSGASVQIDPQLAYITTAWWFENATGLTLYGRSPRGTLVPEAASGYEVSNAGRTYTFTIRKGFRFSDGTPVTAASFRYAIDRAANHVLGSPGEQFITNVVGVPAAYAGHVPFVRGVTAKGMKLTIRLVKPDAAFVATMTMPFFQATSTSLPLSHEVLDAYPSAGRYAFTRNEVDVSTSIRRNPFSPHGQGRLDGVDVLWNQDPSTLRHDVETGTFDEDLALAPSDRQELAAQYGVNKTRFWVRSTDCVGMVAFNSQGRLFRGNARLRRAVELGIDRTAYAASLGPYGARPWSRLLPPDVAGAGARQAYPLHVDLAKARKLARGHLRGGKITVYYRSSGTAFPAQAELVRQSLVALGFPAARITMKGFTGGDIYTAMGQRGTGADLGVSMDFCGDSSFPSIAAASALRGFVTPAYRFRFQSALRLRTVARLRALRRLDLDLMRNVAPLVVTDVLQNQFFFSDRVDPASLRYLPNSGNWDLTALALK
jgi:ABC-type transport system substrate-binding protein